MATEKSVRVRSYEDDVSIRVRAIESILAEKGIIDKGGVDEIIDFFEHKIGPRNGAKVVAKAWTDPQYRKWLLEDSTAAIASLGQEFVGLQGEHMKVMENTPEVHHLITCTLCSCYPWPTLGLPPMYFKSTSYRARCVKEPRAVLKEFGVELSDSTEVRVWDSNSELRYMVLPMRPEGTDDMSEEQLADIVTRDSMLGTEIPKV